MRRCLLVLGMLVLAGCSKEPYQVAPVSGKVTLDDKPLANADVNFQPIAEGTLNPGPGSYGKTNERGEYTLTLVGPDRNGAVVGKHQVKISALDGPPIDMTRDDPRAVIEKVPAKYNNHTTLSFDVTKDGSTKADFPLKSR